MNVIPDVGAVGGVVVITEDHHLVPEAARNVECDGDQVCLGGVALADLTLGIGTACVEVAEADVPEAVCARVIPKDHFDHEFGRCVGTHGMLGQILGDRNSLGHAVGRARGAEDDLPATLFSHDTEKVQSIRDVVDVVLFGVETTLAHICEIREMKYGINVASLERFPDVVLVREVTLHELTRHDSLFVTVHKVVEHHGIKALTGKQFVDMTADISGTADYKYRHNNPF